MSDIFRFTQGSTPLLVSVPHDGRLIPDQIGARMTAAGRAIPDTDWEVARLYNFVSDTGANILLANYSRYVVDLNRSADDTALYPGQVATGLCPEMSFAGDALYVDGGVSEHDRAQRIDTYWRPYHRQLQTTLDAIRNQFGYALLWDAHSIPGKVPRLFDGRLPDLNLGSNDGDSCDAAIASAVDDRMRLGDYTNVHNGRFKGGYITRHYGNPKNNIHALQLEIAQDAYLDEKTLEFDEIRAARLRDTLRKLLSAYTDAAVKSRGTKTRFSGHSDLCT